MVRMARRKDSGVCFFTGIAAIVLMFSAQVATAQSNSSSTSTIAPVWNSTAPSTTILTIFSESPSTTANGTTMPTTTEPAPSGTDAPSPPPVSVRGEGTAVLIGIVVGVVICVAFGCCWYAYRRRSRSRALEDDSDMQELSGEVRHSTLQTQAQRAPAPMPPPRVPGDARAGLYTTYDYAANAPHPSARAPQRTPPPQGVMSPRGVG